MKLTVINYNFLYCALYIYSFINIIIIYCINLGITSIISIFLIIIFLIYTGNKKYLTDLLIVKAAIYIEEYISTVILPEDCG